MLVSVKWVQGEQMPEVSGTETGCLKAGLGPRWNTSLLAAGVLERALWYRIAYFFNQLGSSLPQLTSFTGQRAGPCPILSCRVSEHPYWCGRRRRKRCAEEQCSPCLWWHWLEEHPHAPGWANPAEREHKTCHCQKLLLPFSPCMLEMMPVGFVVLPPLASHSIPLCHSPSPTSPGGRPRAPCLAGRDVLVSVVCGSCHGASPHRRDKSMLSSISNAFPACFAFRARGSQWGIWFGSVFS